MKKGVNKKLSIDNRFLIISLLIISIIAIAIIGSYSGRTINTTKTSLSVSPDVIRPGEYVNIILNPSEVGVYKQYWVCKPNGACPGRQYMHCGSFKCQSESTAQYKSSSSWEEGIYYVKMFDYQTKSFIKA